MELKIDLLKKSEMPISRIAIGGIFIAIAVMSIIVNTVQSEISRFDWFGFGFLGLGIFHIAEGLGFSIDRLFGKAYIAIDSELISLKADIYHKAQSIYWDKIKSVAYKTHKITVETTDNTTVILNLSKFSYPLKREIKETIDCIAKEKKIQSTI